MPTRRIVPRNDGEGSIGKPAKQWGDIQTKKINDKTPSEFVAAENPKAHSLDTHTAVTLAELNAVISDADLGPAYTLPVASAETLGGVKVADPVTVTEGVLGVSAATTSAEGLVELATEAEVQTGTDTTRVVTPSALKAYTEWRPSGFKNLLINGNFDIWQRGGGPFNALANNADRWIASEGPIITRETFVAGQTDVPGNPTYFYRCAYQSISGAGTRLLHQHIENVNTGAGETVTLSFWGRVNTGTKDVHAILVQYFGTVGGGASAETLTQTTFTLSTSWQRFIWTADVPSVAGKAITTNHYLRCGLSNTTDLKICTIDLAKVQLELGSVATPFEQRPIGLELTLCKRYFQLRSTGNVNALDLSPQMRATPTITGSASPFSYSAEI